MSQRNRLLLSLLLVIAVVLGGCANQSPSSDAQPVAAPPSDAEAAPAPSGELPATPADASGMQKWFGDAFPDAAWLSRILSVEFVAGEVPNTGGFADAIVVMTDLDFDAEQALGTEIASAIGDADPEWAKQYVIRFADGNNIMAGDIVDMTP